METVWAIFSGEYSDWEVHGFCETEEEAKQVCAEMNANYDIFGCDEYYYEKIDRMHKHMENGVYEYCYTFLVRNDINSYTFHFQNRTHDDGPVLAYHQRHRAPSVDKISDLKRSNWVYVWLPSDDEMEQAMKIAQDTWYKYLAEKSGV